LPLVRFGTTNVVDDGPSVGVTGVKEPLGGCAAKAIVAVRVPVSKPKNARTNEQLTCGWFASIPGPFVTVVWSILIVPLFPGGALDFFVCPIDRLPPLCCDDPPCEALVLDALLLDALLLDALLLDALVLDALVLDALVLDALVLDALLLEEFPAPEEPLEASCVEVCPGALALLPFPPLDVDADGLDPDCE
jgi:hypothetical protein